MLYRWDLKRCVAWSVIALGAGLLLTIMPAAWIILLLGIALIFFGIKLLF